MSCLENCNVKILLLCHGAVRLPCMLQPGIYFSGPPWPAGSPFPSSSPSDAAAVAGCNIITDNEELLFAIMHAEASAVTFGRRLQQSTTHKDHSILIVLETHSIWTFSPFAVLPQVFHAAGEPNGRRQKAWHCRVWPVWQSLTCSLPEFPQLLQWHTGELASAQGAERHSCWHLAP